MNPEEVTFEIDPDGKPQNDLHHSGRFHLPSALTEMALLRPDAPIEQGERKIVCWVHNPSSEKPALCFFSDTHCSYDPLADPFFSLWN